MQTCERCRWRESITELTAGARLCAHCRHELKYGKEGYTITRDVVNVQAILNVLVKGGMVKEMNGLYTLALST